MTMPDPKALLGMSVTSLSNENNDALRVNFRLFLMVLIFIGAGLGGAMGPEGRFIDGALVIAGEVRYPETSVMGAYFRNLWTILHQIPAALLALGIPVRVIHVLFNVTFISIAFAGISLLAYAFTSSSLLSILIALAVIVARGHLLGPDYPIAFFTPHSFGMAALSMACLAIGLLANRRWFGASVVAGIMPSVHIVLGVWTIGLIASTACLSRFSGNRTEFRQFIKGISVGLALSILSFTIHYAMKIDFHVAGNDELLRSYFFFWDAHRRIVFSENVLEFGKIMGVLLLIYLFSQRQDGARKINWGIAALLLGVVGSTILYQWFHLSRETMPDIVARTIPSRFVNIHYTLFLPIVLGVFISIRPHRINQIFAILLLIVFYADRRYGVDPLPLRIFHLVAILAMLTFVASLIRSMAWDRPIASNAICRLRSSLNRHLAEPSEWRISKFMRAIFREGERGSYSVGKAMGLLPKSHSFFVEVVLGFILLIPISHALISKSTWTFGNFSSVQMKKEGEFYTLLKSFPMNGFLLAAPSTAVAVHRYANKPIVIDPTALDFVPYMPNAVTSIAAIVTDLYGIDFSNPPVDVRNRGALNMESGKEYWKQLSSEQWLKLANRYCIGGLVVPDDWPVSMSPTLDRGGLRLYVPSPRLPDFCKV